MKLFSALKANSISFPKLYNGHDESEWEINYAVINFIAINLTTEFYELSLKYSQQVHCAKYFKIYYLISNPKSYKFTLKFRQ